MSSESRIWEIRPFGSMRGGSVLVVGLWPFNPTTPAYSTKRRQELSLSRRRTFWGMPPFGWRTAELSSLIRSQTSVLSVISCLIGSLRLSRPRGQVLEPCEVFEEREIDLVDGTALNWRSVPKDCGIAYGCFIV